MPLWTDMATYHGPTPNAGGRMLEQRGVVLHIAQGSFEGTIAWQRNPAAQVSSHFVVSEAGEVAQMLDTDATAWTQAAGNGHWVSIEFAGFTGNPLTDAQVAAAARLYARGRALYGWPLSTTDSPAGRGLGWHGMGGAAWGGHPDCPGAPVINQRAAILAAASSTVEEPVAFIKRNPADGAVWVCDFIHRRRVSSQSEWDRLKQLGVEDRGDLAAGEDIAWYGDLPTAAGPHIHTTGLPEQA